MYTQWIETLQKQTKKQENAPLFTYQCTPPLHVISATVYERNSVTQTQMVTVSMWFYNQTRTPLTNTANYCLLLPGLFKIHSSASLTSYFKIKVFTYLHADMWIAAR